jgi:hypothetical protein
MIFTTNDGYNFIILAITEICPQILVKFPNITFSSKLIRVVLELKIGDRQREPLFASPKCLSPPLPQRIWKKFIECQVENLE